MNLEAIINQAWEDRANISSATQGEVREAIETALLMLDQGQKRVVQKDADGWHVNQWLKKAVLLSFRLNEMQMMQDPTVCYDKVPLKCQGWEQADFQKAGFRLVPGAIVRHGAFIGHDAVVMPSFVNIGAYVGAGTMIDSYATIGSCAQIGENCHISSSAVIAGVLEPLQAEPVIIDDGCFVGAGSCIVEGSVIGKDAVIGMGVSIGSSTPIIDRATNQVTYGVVPEGAVVVPGSWVQQGETGLHLSCAVIVKYVDAQTRSKTSVNDLLRSTQSAA